MGIRAEQSRVAPAFEQPGGGTQYQFLRPGHDTPLRQPGRVPSGPSARWVLIPVEDGSTLLGGMERGSFAGYGRYHDDDALLNALHHVLAGPVTPSPVDPVVRAGRLDTAGMERNG